MLASARLFAVTAPALCSSLLHHRVRKREARNEVEMDDEDGSVPLIRYSSQSAVDYGALLIS